MRLNFVLWCLPALLCTSIARGHSAALEEYPERFPGKTLQAIVREWEPPAEDGRDENSLLNAVLQLAYQWTKLPTDELKQRTARLLEENRRGEYRKRFANVLHEMEELAAQGEAGHSEEVADYLDWRMEHLSSDDGYFDKMPSGSWDETRQKAEERTRQWESERNKAMSEIRVKAETAPAVLRPHWLVQCGAMEFHHRRYLLAADYFGRVCEAYPEHSRTEVAVLMLARMKFDEWKQERQNWQRDETKVRRMENEAEEGFENYLKRYPKGRFTADAIGWQGGIMRERGYLGGAMEKFLLQAQTPGHPEIRRRAFQQIEWLLRDFIERPDQLDEYQFPWAKVAAEPCVALRMGYFMLDCEGETDLGALMQRRSGGDHRVLESLVPRLAAIRAAAKPMWKRFDAALAANDAAYRGSRSIVRDVLHAWSAVVRGEAGLVAGLVQERKQGAGADDALLVRAIARLKMGNASEAIRGLDLLDESCPQSPLRRGGDLRRVDAWLELHQPAVAITLLWNSTKETAVWKEEIEERPPLHLSGEVDQRMSALLTFAPLPELEKAALADGVTPGLKTALRCALRVRHLSEGRFGEAQRFAEEADFEGWEGRHASWNEKKEEASSTWRASVSELQKLSNAVEQASGEAKAAAWMALGAAWEKQLWRLLDGGTAYAKEGFGSADLPPPSYELRHHARIVGLGDATAAAMLDQRQETAQAIRCYEEALKLASKGSAASLQAMQAIQTALRTRAEFSAYFMDRSVETDVAAQSRLLHDRIVAEHPGTDAARQSAWWTFRPSRTLGEWQPGDYGLFGREVELAQWLTAAERTDFWTDDWQTAATIKTIADKLKAAFASETSVTQLRAAVAGLKRDIRREAPVAKAGAMINHLDDLDLLLTASGVSEEARKAYFDARMSGSPLDASAEIFAPMQDFVAFWNAAITPSTTALTVAEQKLMAEHPARGARQRIAQAQVCRMQEFLAKFPQSVKREAALARLAINTLRQSRCHCGMSYVDEREQATTAYVRFDIERGIPFDRAAVTAALDAYDRDFPQGRYHWDVLLMRGIAAAEAHDWTAAVRDLMAVLQNPDQRSLHLDASNNLCAIFMELLTPGQRPAVIQAVKSTPGAWQKLDTFILRPTCGWRLRVLLGWLETQR
ncbi:tol-pal system YbgF family protein [Prosthecobacter sp.]|uniref:tol-pal system YbgF family protein n=1 Tax=Prosthecobacter sp. TaxID=1965333 RepID=UPI00378394C4